MKTLKTIFLWIPAIAATCLTCSKNDTSPLQKLEINLVVLDEDGKKNNSLKAETDFHIGLELVNNSADTLFLSYSDYMRLFTRFHGQDDFLLVYELTSEGMVPIGKPYDPKIDLNFILSNVSPVKIYPKHDRVIFGFNWSYNQENSPLRSGKYYSSFRNKTVIENIEKDINTSIKFTVN